MTNSQQTDKNDASKGFTADTAEFVTFIIDGQLFGIPVLGVQDVLAAHKVMHIALAPSEIAGALNLRGRIVTAFDVRRRLGLEPRDPSKESMSIVVEHSGELYSLLVDSVGEVLALSLSSHEKNPPTLSSAIREYSAGIYRLDEQLLVVLDVDRLLDYEPALVA